jgi:DNA-binding CsgD family transcriptional regulator
MKAVMLFENLVPCIITIHDARDISLVYMSKTGTDLLGVTLEDITRSFQEYHARYFNLDDAEVYVPKVTGLLERNNTDEMVSNFQQVRPSPSDPWTWYLSSTRIFIRDREEMPLLFLTISQPIDAKSHITIKVERLMEENRFLRQNLHLYNTLTKREKEIMKYLAQGFSPREISEQLYLSEATVVTHKRNLKAKLKAQTTVDLMKFAQAFDLV